MANRDSRSLKENKTKTSLSIYEEADDEIHISESV